MSSPDFSHSCSAFLHVHNSFYINFGLNPKSLKTMDTLQGPSSSDSQSRVLIPKALGIRVKPGRPSPSQRARNRYIIVQCNAFEIKAKKINIRTLKECQYADVFLIPRPSTTSQH